MFSQLVSVVIAFISGVFWMKWNAEPLVFIPMFVGPFVAVLVGLIGGDIERSLES